MLARDDFEKRYREQAPIGVHEPLYPIFQGYDSVAIRADIELGGTEQKFNLLVGRELQRMGVLEPPMEPQAIITFPILVGTDGERRMGKSLGNYIGVAEPAEDMFGKIMSIPDELIEQYFVLLTGVSAEEIAQIAADMKSGALNPREAKGRLASEIVTMYHSAAAAQAADENFRRLFSGARQQTLEDYAAAAEEVQVPTELLARPVWISLLLPQLGLAKSRRRSRRGWSRAAAFTLTSGASKTRTNRSRPRPGW